MTTSYDYRHLIIHLWDNITQDFLPVGELYYLPTPASPARGSFCTFKYNQVHIALKCPSIDPANLPLHVNSPVINSKHKDLLHPYFRMLLPGSFGNAFLSKAHPKWDSLSEAERLHIVSMTHTDFGALQLNPQYDKYNAPLTDENTLTLLVKSIRDFQRGEHTHNSAIEKLQGALCLAGSTKPMVDYLKESNGKQRRYIVKLNSSGHYNDSRVSAALTSTQRNAGISVCDSHVVNLDTSSDETEDVLFSQNYTRQTSMDDADINGKEPIYKYNRIPMSVLLEDDPTVANSKKPTYANVAQAIEKYSDNPNADLEELFTRAFFSAATNHTSNNLSNIEMVDTGRGKWRLAPSYNNLPNPHNQAEFDVSFPGGVACQSLLVIDDSFVSRLSDSIGIDRQRGCVLAVNVCRALEGVERDMLIQGVPQGDMNTVNEIIPAQQLKDLSVKLEGIPIIKSLLNAASKSYNVVEEMNLGDGSKDPRPKPTANTLSTSMDR